MPDNPLGALSIQPLFDFTGLQLIQHLDLQYMMSAVCGLLSQYEVPYLVRREVPCGTAVPFYQGQVFALVAWLQFPP